MPKVKKKGFRFELSTLHAKLHTSLSNALFLAPCSLLFALRSPLFAPCSLLLASYCSLTAGLLMVADIGARYQGLCKVLVGQGFG